MSRGTVVGVVSPRERRGVNQLAAQASQALADTDLKGAAVTSRSTARGRLQGMENKHPFEKVVAGSYPGGVTS